MKDYKIITDSTANLTEEMIKACDADIVAYVLDVNGEDIPAYVRGGDGDVKAKSFYRAMKEGMTPRTSLINEDRLISASASYLESGRDVLLITCSSKVSGTHAQAVRAAEDMRDIIRGARIYVLDSLNASLGEGLLAVRADELRKQGASAAETLEVLENERWCINSIFFCDSLRYLARSGRISLPKAAVGTVLDIKPVLYADGEGKISRLAAVHGRRKALTRLADEFSRLAVHPDEQTVCISHCNCPEEAESLAETLRGRGAGTIIIQMYDICSGAHIGPGSMAVFFRGKDRRCA